MTTATPVARCEFTALAKGDERYIWLYPDTDRGRNWVIHWIGSQALDPALSLTMADAAALAQYIRNKSKWR